MATDADLHGPGSVGELSGSWGADGRLGKFVRRFKAVNAPSRAGSGRLTPLKRKKEKRGKKRELEKKTLVGKGTVQARGRRDGRSRGCGGEVRKGARGKGKK